MVTLRLDVAMTPFPPVPPESYLIVYPAQSSTTSFAPIVKQVPDEPTLLMSVVLVVIVPHELVRPTKNTVSVLLMFPLVSLAKTLMV